MATISRKLRVLLVLPMYGGSLPVGRSCATALKTLGHLVEVFEAPEFYPAFQALKNLRVTSDRLEYLEQNFLQVVSQAILAKVETFEPDLVLALAQAPLSRQALKRLRRDGVATAMWFVEDYRLFTYWEAFAPAYDFFAVIQKEPFLSRLAQAGVENALYLPLAADPDFHKPLDLTPEERRIYGSDISFLGAGYPNRRLAFREIMGPNFKLWGSDWEGESQLAPCLQRGGARIAPIEAVKIFNATKINLNLHSSLDTKNLVSPGDFVNPRTFELAMCGAFQLVDARALLPELFAPDELATFNDMAGLRQGIEHYLVRPEERAILAAKARARALKDHTYAARLARLIDFVAERRPGWPKAKEAAPALAGLPVELAPQVSELLERLGLPGDVAFKDLVWALRAQQGKLSALDTAILFLDEWRTQYGIKNQEQ